MSLLISTYERPDALRAVLASVERQTRLPDEVVVGDDGSSPTTAEVVAAVAGRGLPLSLARQERDGFRAARLRNLCVAASHGDYLVMIDGDMLLHPDFIFDQVQAATPGFFVQGSRAILSDHLTQRVLTEEGYWPGFFTAGVANRKNLLRLPWLSRRLLTPRAGLRGIRTCNYALWREDFARVNGFNEDFVGWGREDSEFTARLLHSGVRRRNLRFAALACHLYHLPQARSSLARNDQLLERL
ncbi:MAG: glycosyltransferase family 2 protein [Planctomycetota bacterium]|nr:glycosyltransferase family 2 protein [Planctomycetota bacterium]